MVLQKLSSESEVAVMGMGICYTEIERNGNQKLITADLWSH